MMKKILTTNIEKKYKNLTLDYTYKKPLVLGGREKYSISSNKLCNHDEILTELICNGLIKDNGEIVNYLMNKDYQQLYTYYTNMGDMIARMSNISSIIYCPSTLTEYQKLKFRTYYEYFLKYLKDYSIVKNNGKELNFYEDNKESFLEENDILNDEYILKLNHKYQDYL